MTVTDEFLTNNDAYATSFDKGELPLPPAKRVAVWPAWTRLDPARARARRGRHT
jgi:hypothetical protein